MIGDPLSVLTKSALAVGVVTTLGLADASAAITYPGPFVGTTVTYTDAVEASADPINDPEPLYGAPSISGDVLDFNPSAAAFSADAPPPDTTDGALTVVMTSNTAANLTTVIISESGDYAFTGAAPAGELVAASLLVQVLNPLNDALLGTASASFTELYDGPPVEAGAWSNSVTIDLTPFATTSVKLVINNLLQASGNAGNTALINKSDFKIDTPEPASAALIAAGSGLMLARRRK